MLPGSGLRINNKRFVFLRLYLWPLSNTLLRKSLQFYMATPSHINSYHHFGRSCCKPQQTYFVSIRVPCIFYHFVKQPTKAQIQLLYKLSRSYMFRHYRVILAALVVQRYRAGLWYQSQRVQTRPKPPEFSVRRNPQHAFLREGSKAVCPMSYICGV